MNECRNYPFRQPAKKTSAAQIRVKAEAAMADVRRRSEKLNSPRGRQAA
jgi:hypothetical protein